MGTLHAPVAGPVDLLGEHPVDGLDQLRVVGGQSGVGERDGGQAGVPDRGLAGLDHPGTVLAPYGEPVQGRKAGAQHGVVEVVAEEVQGDDGVDGGRLDAAPAAVVLLPLDDPAGGGAHRGAAQLADGDLVVEVQRLVEALEEAVPAGGGGERPRRVGPARIGVQLVEAERRRAHRAFGRDDRQRHDGLPRPASEVIDVEREPLGEVEELRGQFGQVVPLPPAEEGQPDAGEDPGRGHAALLTDPCGGRGHVRCVRGVPGEAQGDIGLDGGGEFAGPAVEGGPGAVRALFAADVAGRGCGELRVLDAQELTKHQIFGVHRDVGLEVALPPSGGVLDGEQIVRGAGGRTPGGLRRVVSYGGLRWVGLFRLSQRWHRWPRGPGAAAPRCFRRSSLSWLPLRQ